MNNQLPLPGLDSRPRWERLVPLSILRLRTMEPPEGYLLAYSGGKDSDVLLTLAMEAGVKFEAVYHLTTIDPPEVVRHVRAHPEVRIARPKRSMYQLIRKKGLPSRMRRWCCRELKERTYPGRVMITGVRWAESARRSTRRMVESANRCKSMQMVHPIIDWQVADIWGYIEARGIEICPLYAEGWKRLGCVCCPLSSQGRHEAERWPRIANAMKRSWFVYCAENPGKIEDPEGMWVAFLGGDLGRKGGKPSDACPLFADLRDGEENRNAEI